MQSSTTAGDGQATPTCLSLFDRELPISIPVAPKVQAADIEDPVFGPIIYAITRQQLIEDGTLIDVSEVAREAGLKIHTAITAGAWEDCIAWSDKDSAAQTYQDESGRLWDVLWMAVNAARSAPDSSQLLYKLYRVSRDGRSREPQLTELKLMIGPGDAGEPVATILLPWED